MLFRICSLFLNSRKWIRLFTSHCERALWCEVFDINKVDSYLIAWRLNVVTLMEDFVYDWPQRGLYLLDLFSVSLFNVIGLPSGKYVMGKRDWFKCIKTLKFPNILFFTVPCKLFNMIVIYCYLDTFFLKKCRVTFQIAFNP